MNCGNTDEMKIDLRRWPAVHLWVFIAHSVLVLQLAEATGSNPVEAPKIFFFFSGYFVLA